MDIQADREHFKTQEDLLRKIRLEIGDEGHVFLDEIQRKENAGVFLKGIYDMGLDYKFIVSGSGSVELKEHIHESLAGRKRMFELFTLSFLEFVNFRTAYRYENKLPAFFEAEKTKLRALFEEYMNFGGYPRVVLASEETEKRKIISEIYQSYIERDIFNLLGVRKEESFIHLVRILASQIGNLLNISELSNTLGISRKTVEQYIWYLQKTFVIKKITPFYRNPRKEITKSPVVYFTDLGLRNYAIGEFGRAVLSTGAGFLFENFIFGLLYEKARNGDAKLHFWRTKDGAEIDLVYVIGGRPTPVEVKFSVLREPKIGRAMKNFVTQFTPVRAYIVNLYLEETISDGGTQISFVGFYKMPFLDFG